MPADTEARLTKFTELVATAIANAESRAGLARLAEEQAALRRVATLVARGAPAEEVFAAVAEEVAGCFPLCWRTWSASSPTAPSPSSPSAGVRVSRWQALATYRDEPRRRRARDTLGGGELRPLLRRPVHHGRCGSRRGAQRSVIDALIARRFRPNPSGAIRDARRRATRARVGC